jgi:negative regulator of flagellin synthesis FlgM
MMISDKQIQQVYRLYGSQAKVKMGKIEKGQEPGAVDKVNLSTRGQEIQLALQSIKATPDIRQDRVEALHNAIKSGTYHVSSLEVAEKMLGRLIVDRSLR